MKENFFLVRKTWWNSRIGQILYIPTFLLPLH